MSRYDESLNLIAVLDHLRDAYDLAKEAGHSEITGHLMEARRRLLVALHQSLNLHSQLAELQERVGQCRETPPQNEALAVLTPVSGSNIRRMSRTDPRRF